MAACGRPVPELDGDWQEAADWQGIADEAAAAGVWDEADTAVLTAPGADDGRDVAEQPQIAAESLVAADTELAAGTGLAGELEVAGAEVSAAEAAPDGVAEPLPVVPDIPAAQPGRWRRPTATAGHIFAWLTVLPALVTAAWLLTGLPLLLAGRFLPMPAFLIASPLAALLAVLAARCVPGRWPMPSGSPGPVRQAAAWWGLAGTVAVAGGFGAWQLVLNSPQLIVRRQPGVYLQLGYWIAQHGRLPIPATPAAFGGSRAGLTFASYGFAVHGTSVASWQPPGLPIMLAAGTWIHGLPGMAAVSPVLGALAVLTVGGLTGRLAGLAWAPLGALVTALALPEILTSRSAYAEPLVELLLFGGLCLIADSLTPRPPDAGVSLGGWPRRGGLPSPASTMAVLGGLSLALAPLAQPGTLLLLLPVIPFAAVLVAGQRPRATPFTIGLVAGAGLALAGELLLPGPGLQILAPLLRLTGLAIVCTATLTVAVIAVGSRQRVRRLLTAFPLRWLPEAAAVVVAAAAIAFAVRPYFQVVRGAEGGSAAYVGWLQQAAGLPGDPRRLYTEDSLYWVVWYLGLPALLLAVAGLALLARRCARALISWRDPDGDARVQTLPMLVIGWAAAVTLWHPGTVPDQPWAGRTLVPAVLPGLTVCAVWAAAWLVARSRNFGAGAVAVGLAAAFFAAAATVPGAVTSFAAGAPVTGGGIGPDGLPLSGAASQRTSAGEEGALRNLCGRIGLKSSVILLDPDAAREYAPVLRGMCGIPAGVMAGASHGQVLSVVQAIERAGRRPVLLASRQAVLASYASRPRRVLDLLTQQDAHLLTRPPVGTWPVRYQLWMTSPRPVAGT